MNLTGKVGDSGVAALLNGIQFRPDRPLDMDTYSPDIWESLAAATTCFAQGLLTNPWVKPENLSPAGAENLAVTYQKMMPLHAYGVLTDLDGDGLFREYKMHDTSGEFVDRAIPELARAQIADLFGLVMLDPDAALHLGTAIGLTNLALLGAAADGTGLTPDTALQLVTALQAIRDGAKEGAPQGVITRIEEQVASIVDTVADIASYIPIPGTGKLGSALAEQAATTYGRRVVENIVDGLTQQAADALIEQAANSTKDAWTTSLAIAADITRDDSGTSGGNRAAVRTALDGWIEMLSPNELEANHNGDSEQYAQDVTADYNSVRTAADLASQNED